MTPLPSMLAGLLPLLLAASGGAPQRTLRFGVETRSLPYCFVPGIDYSKEDPRKPPAVTAAQLTHLTGLEVEVMNALGRRLGVKPVVVPVAWFDLEAGLLANRFDAILASWTPSDKTPSGIAASEAYYQWGLLVAARADDKRIRTTADLAGLKVGHFADPVVVQALTEMGAGLDAHLVSAEDGTELFKLLRAGAVDAVIFDSPGAGGA